jgi:hypothetical protein
MRLWLLLVAAAAAAPFAAPPWGGLTYHVSVVPHEIGWLRSVVSRHILPLRQCFTTVAIVVDLPHGGKTYGRRYLAPPAAAAPVPVIRAAVGVAIGPTMEMLRVHCRRRTPLTITVLNHTTLIPWMHRTFNMTGNSTVGLGQFGHDEPARPLPERFFMNTVMYVWSMLHCRTRYMLHADVDTIGYRPLHVRSGGAVPGFVAQSVAALAAPNVLLTMSVACDRVSLPPPDFPGMSCRFFLMDTAKAPRLVPLGVWADHVETMFSWNMRQAKLVSRQLKTKPCPGKTWFTRKVLQNRNWQ